MRATTLLETLPARRLLAALGLCAAAAWAASGCFAEDLPDGYTELWRCKTTADCRGDGFVCVAQENGTTFCCRPEAEACDGKDNDCNGKVDDVGEQACYSGDPANVGVGICRAGSRTCKNGVWSECFGEIGPAAQENCNGVDDDCDGGTDESFDFNEDEAHCGDCYTSCPVSMWCVGGKCSKDAESCLDQIDNDRDGDTDCADSDCPGKPCKASPSLFTCDDQQQCSCHGVVAPGPEATCDDHGDDDCDGDVDCADADCESRACGSGCVCADLKMSEAGCDNYNDDDGDGAKDCEDLDCEGASCGAGCACAGQKKSETDCGDGMDNDGDRTRDCVDEDCAGKACKRATDAGLVDGTCGGHACN